jgi:hypothetical protein
MLAASALCSAQMHRWGCTGCHVPCVLVCFAGGVPQPARGDGRLQPGVLCPHQWWQIACGRGAHAQAAHRYWQGRFAGERVCSSCTMVASLQDKPIVQTMFAQVDGHALYAYALTNMQPGCTQLWSVLHGQTSTAPGPLSCTVRTAGHGPAVPDAALSPSLCPLGDAVRQPVCPEGSLP